MQALYDSEIAFTDEYIGRLIGQLKRDKLYDKSLIVFLADHGEEFRDHGAFFHMHTLYHELLHVPLIVKVPGSRASKVVGGNFPLIDLFPSIVGQIGCSPQWLGLSGKAIDMRSVTRMQDSDIFSANEQKRSIWNSRYKLVVTLPTKSTPESDELFLVQQDPLERVNQAAKLPDVVKNLRQLVFSHQQEIGAEDNGAVKPKDGKEDAAEAKRMKALGYLQ